MWMMGYNEAEDLNINMMESYANNGSRKLRPLVPRPTCAAASSSNRFHSTHHDHLLPNHHHHHLVAAEHHKREFNSQQMVVVSSRWNPTPEQLQTLEELYRRGTRTPSADEIQHITAQLRRYGKIEGKNVFYWFQNHKARERQKRRRQLDNPTTDLHQPPYYTTTDINTINIDLSTERKESELNRTSYEVEETRNWAIPTFSEKVLRERTSKTESRMTSMADQGRVAVEQEEEDEGNDQLLLLHRRRKSYPEKNATWKHMMQCLSSSTPPTNHNSTITTTCTPATPSVPKTSSFLVVSPNSQRHHFHHDVDSFQTLELFPVTSNGHGREQSEKCFFPTNDVSISPRQFIEFLPLKN